MKDNMMAWCKGMGGDEKIAEAIYNECSTIMESDECDAAAKIGLCFKEIGAKHNINIDF